MNNILLSELERFYIIQGAELGCRTDGRAPNEYRPLELESGVFSQSNGSAGIRIGETYLMGCVKMEVGKPQTLHPNEGIIEINVECYPTAVCGSTEKQAKEVAENLKTILQTVYQCGVYDLRKLCIQPSRQCWIVYIDLLLLEGGGNFLDAASIVIKAALLDSIRLATYKTTASTFVKKSTVNSQHVFPYFDEGKLPIFITVHKIGNSYVVDASAEEEACSLSRVSVIVYPDGTLGSLLQEGCGSCHLDTVLGMTELAKMVGKQMNTAISKTLKLEHQLRS